MIITKREFFGNAKLTRGGDKTKYNNKRINGKDEDKSGHFVAGSTKAGKRKKLNELKRVMRKS